MRKFKKILEDRVKYTDLSPRSRMKHSRYSEIAVDQSVALMNELGNSYVIKSKHEEFPSFLELNNQFTLLSKINFLGRTSITIDYEFKKESSSIYTAKITYVQLNEKNQSKIISESQRLEFDRLFNSPKK